MSKSQGNLSEFFRSLLWLWEALFWMWSLTQMEQFSPFGEVWVITSRKVPPTTTIVNEKNSDKFPWNLDIWLYESNSPLESGHNFFFLRYILKAIYSFNETRHFFTNTFCLSHVFFARTFDQPFKPFCLVNCFLHSVFNFIIPIPFLLFSTCSLFPLFLFLSFLSLFLFLLFLNSFSFFPL